MSEQTLYARLGGYDAIAAVVGELLGLIDRLRFSPMAHHSPSVNHSNHSSDNIRGQSFSEIT
jgi:hypothetical protein